MLLRLVDLVDPDTLLVSRAAGYPRQTGQAVQLPFTLEEIVQLLGRVPGRAQELSG